MAQRIPGKDDGWGLVGGKLSEEEGGHPLVARVRTHVDPEWAALPYRLTLSVKIKNPAPNGLPNLEEMRSLDELENRITTHIEPDAGAELVLLVSAGGERSIILHVEDETWHARQPAAFADAFGEYEAEVLVHHDPEWTVHSAFAAKAD
ncbi:MAG: DUF695 domain-containing protein [Planctomycetota bacterium]